MWFRPVLFLAQALHPFNYIHIYGFVETEEKFNCIHIYRFVETEEKGYDIVRHTEIGQKHFKLTHFEEVR